MVFRAISSTDHFSPLTGVDPAITIWETGDGAAFKNPAAGATTATEIASGFYKFTLGTTDVDAVGPMAWRAAHAGMDDVGDVYEVVSAFNAGFTGIPAVVAGGTNGLVINGTNSGTVTLAALTVTGATTLTGNVALADGLTIAAPSTAGRAGITVTGNGAGAGIAATGGSSGDGISATGGASGNGLTAQGVGTTKHGINAIGGATTSAGIYAKGGGTSGDGMLIAATSGHGISTSGTGTTKHGIHAAGGATTSHGINAVGGGVGHGILATSGGGATGDGIQSISAATAGNGLNLEERGVRSGGSGSIRQMGFVGQEQGREVVVKNEGAGIHRVGLALGTRIAGAKVTFGIIFRQVFRRHLLHLALPWTPGAVG